VTRKIDDAHQSDGLALVPNVGLSEAWRLNYTNLEANRIIRVLSLNKNGKAWT
jgi:hypothetical protein